MKKKSIEINAMTAILISAIILFSAVVFIFLSGNYGSDYQRALAAEDPSDICKTPAGYTEESWRQHMSHHPERYKQCLQN